MVEQFPSVRKSVVVVSHLQWATMVVCHPGSVSAVVLNNTLVCYIIVFAQGSGKDDADEGKMGIVCGNKEVRR